MMTPFQFVFYNSLYFLLTLLFVRYSLFTYVFSCFLSRSSRRFLLILASFLTFLRVFSTYSTPFASCFLWPPCLLLSGLFSSKTLSPQTWIITISCGWQSFSSAGIVALQVHKKNKKYWELLLNYNLTNLIPAQNACRKLFAHAASHQQGHVNPSFNA